MNGMAKHYAILFGLLILAGLALAFTVDVKLTDQPGVRVALPEQLGDWTGREIRYCHNPQCLGEFVLQELPDKKREDCPKCGGKLHNMSLAEYDALPKDTVFVKTRYARPNGEEIFVAIVLSGRDRESIHRPERCLVAQGHAVVNSDVIQVPIEGARKLGVMVMESARSVQTPQGVMPFNSFYAYWFVGQGRETPYHLARMFWLAWDRVVKSRAHKWAYVSVAGRRGDDAAYRAMLSDFIRQLHAAIVLPASPGAG